MDPQDRPVHFVPKRYTALRHVPLYTEGIKERFNRCLDLYMAPRAMKRRLRVSWNLVDRWGFHVYVLQ